MRATLGTPGSRTGSVRSFNTNYGRQSPESSPKPQRSNTQKAEFMRQQEEYRRQQLEMAERQAAQEAEAQRQYEEQLRLQAQAQAQAAQAAQMAQMAQESPARQNVRNLINNYEPDVIERHIGNGENVVQHTTLEQTRTQTNTVEQTYDGSHGQCCCTW